MDKPAILYSDVEIVGTGYTVQCHECKGTGTE